MRAVAAQRCEVHMHYWRAALRAMKAEQGIDEEPVLRWRGTKRTECTLPATWRFGTQQADGQV